MKRRHQPKQFAPARSRRGREKAAAEALGVSPFIIPVAEILKDIYHCGWRRPAWARLAYARGWMTGPEYYDLKATERAPSISELVYRESPLFGMLRKSA